MVKDNSRLKIPDWLPGKTMYHVHVYQVSAMVEIDVAADTNEEAKKKALRLVEKGQAPVCKFPDCGKMAIVFEK